jgi:hypothetical protein
LFASLMPANTRSLFVVIIILLQNILSLSKASCTVFKTEYRS